MAILEVDDALCPLSFGTANSVAKNFLICRSATSVNQLSTIYFRDDLFCFKLIVKIQILSWFTLHAAHYCYSIFERSDIRKPISALMKNNADNIS